MTTENTNLVNLHIAEFNALMARNTNWILIVSASFMPLALGTFSFIIDDKSSGIRIWGSVTAMHIFALASFFAAREQINNIAYIESVIRPKLNALYPKIVIEKNRVWEYELRLAKQRGESVLVWDFLPLFATVGMVVLAEAVRERHECYDLLLGAIFLAINVYFYFGIIRGLAKQRCAIFENVE